VLRYQLRVLARRQPWPRLARREQRTLALGPESGAGHAGDGAPLAPRPGAAHMDLPG
jgi:hypothetical protein